MWKLAVSLLCISAGQAFADGWTTDCKVDEMRDTKSCSVTSFEANLLLFFDQSSPIPSVCVIGHDFPGETAFVRVDKNKPFTYSGEGCIGMSNELFNQLKKGKVVRTRRVEWPEQWGKDAEGSLQGLTAAVNEAAAYLK